MAVFADLPVEVREKILSTLHPVLIVRFQRVCRAARALVQDSVKLQYILACFRAGVVDCPSGTRFTTAEKLARVQQWHAAWKRPTPDRRQETILRPQNPAFTIFQTSGPVFAQGAPGISDIEFYLPGSPLRNVQPRGWTMSQLPRYETFAFEWYLDLLVVARRSNGQVILHFLSCTSGAPHPLASAPSVSLTPNGNNDVFKLSMSGDLILLQSRKWGEGVGEKWVLNWRQGFVSLNLNTPATSLSVMSWDCAMFDSRYLLLTFGGVALDDWKPHILAIFDCHRLPRNKRLNIPDDLSFAILSLQLPLLDSDNQYAVSWKVECLSPSFRALPERITDPAFRAMAPPVVRVYAEVDSIPYARGEMLHELLIPAWVIHSAMPQHGALSPLLLRWSTYAPGCRLVCAAKGFGVVHGHRFATITPPDVELSDDRGTWLVVADQEDPVLQIHHFARPGLVFSEADVDEDVDADAEAQDVQVYRVLEASDDHQELLEHEVPTGLPYLETWTDICVAVEAEVFLVEDGFVLLEGSGKPLRAYTF